LGLGVGDDVFCATEGDDGEHEKKTRTTHCSNFSKPALSCNLALPYFPTFVIDGATVKLGKLEMEGVVVGGIAG